MTNINDVSNPLEVRKRFAKYKGKDDAKLLLSTRKDKKFMVIHDNKTTHFGSSKYQDFTKTGDELKRKAYLARSGAIKGDWKKDKYSANSLARSLLW